MSETKKYLSLIALGLYAVSLSAHEILLIPQYGGGQIKLVARFGDPPRYGTASVVKVMDIDDEPHGKKISLNKGLKQDGETFQIGPVDTASQSGIWLFSVSYDNGFGIETPDGRRISATKMDYPAGSGSTHSLRFGKTLVLVGESKGGYDRVIGHRPEIVPQADAFQLKAGEKLPMLVLFDGKPLVGEDVEAGDDAVSMEKLKTNAKGIATLPVHGGLNRMTVEIFRPTGTPQLVDRDGYSASLIFVVGQ